MFERQINSIYSLNIDKYNHLHRVLINADPPYARGLVQSYNSESEAACAVQNFINRYKIAHKYGYDICKLHNGEILFVKVRGKYRWNAYAINMDEKLEDFEGLLEKS